MEIKNPQWLEIENGGSVIYGLNQEWFSTPRKRLSGCGPTTATTLLLYINKRDNGSLPYQNQTVELAAQAMEDVWEFVTPGFMGLHNVEKFARGMDGLIRRYGAPWACQALRVKKQDSLERIVAFIESGLSSDCPIAFLNLHAGDVTAFDGWHWIVLTGLELTGGRYMAVGCDEGKKIHFDLGQWVESTKIGGGLAYLTKV